MTKIHKEPKKSKTVNEERKPFKYQRPERHIQRVDFQRIEDAPLNKFEKEIQRGLAVEPNACELLIREENQRFLLEAMEHVLFSGREKTCLKLTLDSLTPPEIARKLGIITPSVHLHLRRAVQKMKNYLRTHHDNLPTDEDDEK